MESLVATSNLVRQPFGTQNAGSGLLQRRQLLQMAAGLGLSWFLPGLDARAAEARGAERPRSLITLWMTGGPSQLETWDPHPGTVIGGPTKSIPTRQPGLEIASLFPRMAEQMDALCVIRSMVSKEGDHERGTYLLRTGYLPDTTLVHPSLGAILAHELPPAGVEIPRHISILGGQFPARGGFLGDAYDPFKIFDPGRDLRNMVAHVDKPRQTRRLQDLDVIEQSFAQRRRLQAEGTLHRQTMERALTMMSSDQLKAFKIEEETVSTRAKYGDTPFGRGCLVARRLVEVGVSAIEVNLAGFDSHANNFEAHTTNAAILDPAFAALMADLRERHLLDSTVVLCIGEFGRTPRINPLDGRDHHPNGFSAVVGGGGLRGGQCIGATDPSGTKKAPTDPVEVKDLYATILKTLGVSYNKEVLTPIGRPMKFSAGKPIERLLS